MVLARGSTVVSSVLAGAGAAEKRWTMGAKAFQIYSPGGVWWSRKAIILRNAPYTIEAPHPGQMETRINFGEHASRHKGERGFREGLPIIAYYIKTEVTGYKAPDSMRPEDYPSKKLHTIHTVETLKRMMKAKRAARAPALMPPPGVPP